LDKELLLCTIVVEELLLNKLFLLTEYILVIALTLLTLFTDLFFIFLNLDLWGVTNFLAHVSCFDEVIFPGDPGNQRLNVY